MILAHFYGKYQALNRGSLEMRFQELMEKEEKLFNA